MTATPLPEDKLLRSADVCRWLGANVNRYVIKKWVECGVIHRIAPVEGGHGFYDRDEISTKILNNGNGNDC